MHCRSDYCTPPSISSCSEYSPSHVLARLTMPSLTSLKTNNNPCHFPRERVSQANSRAMLDSPLRAGSPLALSEEVGPFRFIQLREEAEEWLGGCLSLLPAAAADLTRANPPSPSPRLGYSTTVMLMQCTCTHSLHGGAASWGRRLPCRAYSPTDSRA